MLDLKSIIIGVLFGIALVFVLGASHKKGKKGTPPVGMFQLSAIPNSDSKAVILHTASGEYKIANLDLSPNFESGDRFMGPPPESFDQDQLPKMHAESRTVPGRRSAGPPD